jgi:hypothetical protein
MDQWKPILLHLAPRTPTRVTGTLTKAAPDLQLSRVFDFAQHPKITNKAGMRDVGIRHPEVTAVLPSSTPARRRMGRVLLQLGGLARGELRFDPF